MIQPCFYKFRFHTDGVHIHQHLQKETKLYGGTDFCRYVNVLSVHSDTTLNLSLTSVTFSITSLYLYFILLKLLELVFRII